MKKSFFCQLVYGFTGQPNCSNFGDRLMHWASIYDYLSEGNLLDEYTIVVPKKHWPELKYIKLPNTISTLLAPHDYIEMTNQDIMDLLIHNSDKNLFIKSTNINFGERSNSKNLQYINVLNTELSKKIKKFKRNNPYMSIHIRKVVGVDDSQYSSDKNGYPDLSWELYNKMINLFKETSGLPVYVASDLPIEIIKENLETSVITRTDFISEHDEIYLVDEYSEKVFLEANMCDWLAIYYSDYKIMSNTSKYSLTSRFASKTIPDKNLNVDMRKIFTELDKINLNTESEGEQLHNFKNSIKLNFTKSYINQNNQKREKQC